MKKDNTTKKENPKELTEERVRAIVRDEIHKWEVETFTPRLMEH